MKIKVLGWGIGLLITAIVLAYAWFLIKFSWPLDFSGVHDWGNFGDSFGVLTSLFSGLAFVGLIVTILLQSEELKAQRAEIRNQIETAELQRFENTLFNLIESIRKSLNSLSNTYFNTDYGIDALYAFDKISLDFDDNESIKKHMILINKCFLFTIKNNKVKDDIYIDLILSQITTIELKLLNRFNTENKDNPEILIIKNNIKFQQPYI